MMLKFLLINFNVYLNILIFLFFLFFCLTFYFLKRNKIFLMNRLNFLLNEKFNLLLILLLLLLLLLLLILVHLVFYIVMYNVLEDLILQRTVELVTKEEFFFNSLFISYIFSSFSKLNIISTIITIIICYIVSLIWFYYIFIYKNENSVIFVYVYNILFFILGLFIFICIFKYNIYIAHAMIKNNNNLFFNIDLQNFGRIKFVAKNMIENKELIVEAVNLKGQILTDNKEAVFCYNSKDDLYNYNIIKNNNVNVATNIMAKGFINKLDVKSEVIELNNSICKCVFAKIEDKL